MIGLKVDSMLATAKTLADDRRKCLPIPERIKILEKTALLVEERLEDFAYARQQKRVENHSLILE